MKIIFQIVYFFFFATGGNIIGHFKMNIFQHNLGIFFLIHWWYFNRLCEKNHVFFCLISLVNRIWWCVRCVNRTRKNKLKMDIQYEYALKTIISFDWHIHNFWRRKKQSQNSQCLLSFSRYIRISKYRKTLH